MPVSYTLHPDLELVATRFIGAVSEDEFVDLYRSIFADPGYELGTNELADLREAGQLDLTPAVLRKVEYMTRMRYGPEGPSFRTALIAPADLAFAIGRMYGVFASPGPEDVAVFRTADEAFEHLGVAPIPPERLHRPR